MAIHDAWWLGLLPVAGLSVVSACASPGTAAANASVTPVVTPEPETAAATIAAVTPGLIERDGAEPLSVVEALARSGRESLAAGHYAAAFASLDAAVQRQPESLAELGLELIDAAIGVRDLSTATRLIGEARAQAGTDRQLQAGIDQRQVLVRELDNAFGLAACEASIDATARPLTRVDSALEAWNTLRSALPTTHAIPIPTSEHEAQRLVCPEGCRAQEPSFARIDGDNEATIGLVIAHTDGAYSLIPDLLHPRSQDCEDNAVLAIEDHGGLVQVRAFADHSDHVDTDDWHLVEIPEYGAPQGGAAVLSTSFASSGYPSSGYASSGHASSGHASSGYASSGYSYYGCGGGYGDYEYPDTCEVHAHIERDLILDVARGEVVLDIVRTGPRGAALGRVRVTPAAAGPVVDVQACGVERRSALRYS